VAVETFLAKKVICHARKYHQGISITDVALLCSKLQ